MAERRTEEIISIGPVENLYIEGTHIHQAPSDAASVAQTTSRAGIQADAPTTLQADSGQKSDVEQQAIDEIRREAEIDARDDKLSSGQCPDVNPTMLEIDIYRGVDPEKVKQLLTLQPEYFSQLGGKQISYDVLTLMISDGRGKFISLSGNPGSGKTTLSKKIVRQLQRNKKNLVLHISFMYLNYGDDKLTLQEFLIDKQFPNASKSTCNVAFQWIVNNQVLCYFVFDGLDQATWSLQNSQPFKESYDTPLSVQQLVANLCSKMFLGKSSLIFTSRPHSLLSLPLKLRPKTTISVQDFSTDDMKALFYFYAGEKASELWEKLEKKSPQILDFCHNPMLLQYVVYAGLHDNAENLNTMTNIFGAVLEQLGNSEHTHGYDIDSLKRPLGKMAYKGMLNKSVVFHSEDLEEVGLQDVHVQDVVIKAARFSCFTKRKVFKGSEVLFYCSHQMLQEVFAAYYICLFMSLEEFQQVVSKVVKGGHWSMVRRFMCGILLGNANDGDILDKAEDFSLSEAATSQPLQADVVKQRVKPLIPADSSSNDATTSQHGTAGDAEQKDSSQCAKVRYKVIREIPNRSWNEFARKKLNLPDYVIDDIEVDYKNDIQEQKYQMILHWERMNGESNTQQSLLLLCEEFKTHHREDIDADQEVVGRNPDSSSAMIPSANPTMSTLQLSEEELQREKRKVFLEELRKTVRNFRRHQEHLELLVDLQECCEEAKKHLARFCPQLLSFSAIPFSMTRCHALVDFLPRITRTDVWLELMGCDLDHDKLQQIYNGMKNMKVKLDFLDLSYNKKIGKNGVEIISGIFTKVRVLRLFECGFDSESIRILNEVLSHLEDPPKVRGLSEEEQREDFSSWEEFSSSSDSD